MTVPFDDFISMALFQPALPMRGVTFGRVARGAVLLISTRTPHAGSDVLDVQKLVSGLISTRTPHAGSDQPLRSDADLVHISTRTPHAGSDAPYRFTTLISDIFQPALPMRGVT